MKTLLHTLALSLALVSSNAHAHGDAKPQHGGILQVVNDLQFELVPPPKPGDAASLYVSDHGKPMDASKLSGKLTVLQGTQTSEAPPNLPGLSDWKLRGSASPQGQGGGHRDGAARTGYLGDGALQREVTPRRSAAITTRSGAAAARAQARHQSQASQSQQPGSGTDWPGLSRSSSEVLMVRLEPEVWRSAKKKSRHSCPNRGRRRR